MNPLTNVKNIQKLNERMLEMGVEDSQAWHKQYKDSAYIFIGGLPYDLTEGDILCVFSQYGEIVNINLVRDKKTGKTKGFCFLCYEDQRSTILAVDNFNGIKLGGRIIRVDHCSNYRRPKSDEKDEHGNRKEIIEEGCAPKTPPPSPPQQNDEEDVLELPKKRKKEKKQKKQNKEEKSQKKKRKMSSSSEEEDGEKKQKLDLLKKELPRNQTVQDKAHQIQRNRHERTERDPPRAREGQRDHDVERDRKGKGDMQYSSRGDYERDTQVHEHNREHDRKPYSYERKMGHDRDRTNRDKERQVSDRRDQRDSSYVASHGDRDREFDEKRRDRFDKQRDHRTNEGRSYERSNRNDYTDRKDKRY